MLFNNYNRTDTDPVPMDSWEDAGYLDYYRGVPLSRVTHPLAREGWLDAQVEELHRRCIYEARLRGENVSWDLLDELPF